LKKRFNVKRFIAIVKKEFIQIKRDPISLRLPIIMPFVMMFLFGYAVKTELENIPIIVLDQSNTQASREYIQKFLNSGYFILKGYAFNMYEIEDSIDTHEVKAALVIPPGFAEDLKRNKTPQTLLIIDGSDPTTARTAFNSGILISEVYSLSLKNEVFQKQGLNLNLVGIDLRTQVWFNPNLESTRFTIPGLVGLILQNITIMLTAFALVREKERGTIEQLIVTPIRPSELIVGKLIPYILIGYAGFLFALGMAVFWFQAVIEGSLFLLLLLGFLFVLCSLSIGMLISTFAGNQLQAMMVMILIVLPSILLSGFIFPREAMPAVINWIGYIIPLTYFLNIIRGIVLKGIGMEYLWQDAAVLGVFTLVILFIAIMRFRKSLD
jgi:ABC-2 type transport system permease protein